MGLIISVYRNSEIPADCTNGGVSSTHNALCLVNASGPFEPSADYPPVIMRKHPTLNVAHIVPAYLHVEPGKENEWRPVPLWWMMGGNYAATSDNRFRELHEQLTGVRFCGAVAIHDRNEG